MANSYAMQAALQKFYYITGEMEKLQTDLESLISEHGISRETIEGKIIIGLLSEVARIQISARKLTITVDDGPLDSALPRIRTEITDDGPASVNVPVEQKSIFD